MLDQGLDWQACAQPVAADLAGLAMQQSGDTRQPIEVAADSAVASSLDNSALFSGDVQLRQGTQEIRAEQIALERSSGNIDASGDVLLTRPDLRLAAAEVHYNLQSGQGEARQAEYRLPGIMARGTAERAEFVSASDSRFHDISYTTCAPGNSDWQLSAAQLEIDRAEGLGTAHDAKLSFKGVPLAYLPTLTFPIDERRRSGVLPPTVGYSENLGFDLAVPYYLNLAPNYDLTLTPRLMSERGLMLNGEFRFLTGTTEGRIDGSFLPNDRGDTLQDGRRGSLAIDTRSRYSRHLTSELRINQVSDEDFLADFGGNLDATSASFLERAGEFRYDTAYWSVLSRIQSYQTIDASLPAASRPYARVPQVAFSMNRPSDNTPLAYHLDGEFVEFAKNGFVEGTRIDLQPAISAPIRRAHYHFVPRASLRYTGYRLDNQAAGLSDSPERLAPMFSVDGGLYYDRATSFFGRGATQTLEPRMYYLLVPRQDHADIPLFDTSDYDFSFDSLFRENRFNGADRLGDANQLTLALTTRYLGDSSGRELLRASIGQMLYFRDREVQLNNAAPADTDDTSALVGELAADLGGGWRSRGGLMWDPHDNSIQRALAQASFRGDDDRILNLAYRLRDGVATYTDIGAVWPISNDVRMIARWNYSISEGRNLETLAGVEYGACCWKVRTVIRQHADGNNDQQNLGFMVQLELNGLGKLGNDIESLLDDGIYGYRRDDD